MSHSASVGADPGPYPSVGGTALGINVVLDAVHVLCLGTLSVVDLST